MRNHPPRGNGHATIPSPPFSSLDLGHARTRAQREFKAPDLRLEPQSATWESSDVAITPSAGRTLGELSKGPRPLDFSSLRSIEYWALALKLDSGICSSLCLVVNTSVRNSCLPAAWSVTEAGDSSYLKIVERIKQRWGL